MRLSLAIALEMLVAAGALLVIRSNGQTPQGNKDEQINSFSAEPGEGRASEWTPERMRAAQPVPLPIDDPEAVRAAIRARGNLPPQSPGAFETCRSARD